MVRGMVVAGCAVLAAAALAGCRVGGSGAGAVGGGTPATPSVPGAPSTPATPAAPGGGGPSGVPVGLLACRAAALRLVQLPGGDGAMGTMAVRIEVTNTSVRACTLRGYPAFRLTVHTAGRDVPQPVVPRHGSLGGPFAARVSTVRLAPGGRAGFFVAFRNFPAGSANCPVADKMHVALPGQATPLVGPVQIRVCADPMDVSAFVPAGQLHF